MRRGWLIAGFLLVCGCESATPPAESFRRSCETAAIAAQDVAQAYLDRKISYDVFRAMRQTWLAARQTCAAHPSFDATSGELATTQVTAFIAAAATVTGQEYGNGR